MKKIIIALSAILLFISCMDNMKKSPEKESIVALDRKLEENKVAIPTGNDKGFVGTYSDTTASPQQSEPDKKKQNQTIPAVQPDWDKKIIKTATLNLEVKDYKSYNSSLRDKIKQSGGYVAQEEQTQSDYKIENTITIKVPVDQFDNAVNLITTNVEGLNEKKITSQDVTTEVVDTKSRLEAKKQVRLRYLDLLKQARNMEEILSVQSEINGIQEAIESAAGRIEYLNHSSSFSTINLTFYQVLNASAIDSEKPSFSTKLSTAFRSGWSWVTDLFIGIVSIWPLLMMIFAGFIIYKRIKTPKAKHA